MVAGWCRVRGGLARPVPRTNDHAVCSDSGGDIPCTWSMMHLPLSRGATALLRHRRPHREAPDRRLRRLCHHSRSRSGRPELYLPRSWTDDPERCWTARIPQHRRFELARPPILRPLASPSPRSRQMPPTGRTPYGTWQRLSCGSGAARAITDAVAQADPERPPVFQAGGGVELDASRPRRAAGGTWTSCLDGLSERLTE